VEGWRCARAKAGEGPHRAVVRNLDVGGSIEN